MAKTEKIFYILEQVRLCLDRKDYIRSGHHPRVWCRYSRFSPCCAAPSPDDYMRCAGC